MHRIFKTNTLDVILVALSWAVIALMIYLFLRVIATQTSWIYLD
jgi:hypothetical protein